MFENVKMPEGMSSETLEHLINPKNYGKLDEPSCVGVAVDEKTGEYVIFYTMLDDETVKDVSYATNGCQDTVVIGSMFTQMIKGNNLEYANRAIQKMLEKLGGMTPQQQICADIVFSAYIASMKNLENLQKGQKEEMHVLKMKDSCDAVGMQNGNEGENKDGQTL
jgi:nitrogen fixation NifU-like protein